MDLKLLEDLVALAEHRSFVRAAEARNVTQPAFGRRVRALEAWAGAPLVTPGRSPVTLTEAGRVLLSQASAVIDTLSHTRKQLKRAQHDSSGVLRLATGRTLAHTLVAGWLVEMTRQRKPLHGHRFEVVTGSMSDVAAMLEQGEVDLLCCYEHPAMSIKLSKQRFKHITLANDKLVPVSRADSRGEPQHSLESGPVIDYHRSLSLGALLGERLLRDRPDVLGRVCCVCDSADSIQELALRGLGVAWLPWSMVAADCKRKLLTVLGRRSDEVHFEVRLYRPRAHQSPLIESIWSSAEA